MDNADRAQQHIEKHLARALNNLNRTHIPSTRKCLYCEEPVEKGRFCDAECRDEYEKIALKRARN